MKVVTMCQLATATLVTAMISAPASAQQDYPNRPIHVTYGYPVGGGADITARQFMNSFEKASGGKVFVIDNKPGNNGNLAITLATKFKPDGYSLMLGSSSNMVGARFFYKDVAFDPVRDFIPVGSFLEGGFMLLTGPATPATTLQEFTFWLKSRPQNRFGYSNQLGLLASEYYKARGGFPATPVAYKSAIEAYPDLQSGLLEFMIADTTTATSMVKTNKLKAIATASAKRVVPFPDLKTMRESGFDDADFSTWWALYTPAGTPQPIVSRLYEWLKLAAADPQLKKAWEVIGNMTLDDDGAATQVRLKQEIARWEPLVKAAGLTPPVAPFTAALRFTGSSPDRQAASGSTCAHG